MKIIYKLCVLVLLLGLSACQEEADVLFKESKPVLAQEDGLYFTDESQIPESYTPIEPKSKDDFIIKPNCFRTCCGGIDGIASGLWNKYWIGFQDFIKPCHISGAKFRVKIEFHNLCNANMNFVTWNYCLPTGFYCSKEVFSLNLPRYFAVQYRDQQGDLQHLDCFDTTCQGCFFYTYTMQYATQLTTDCRSSSDQGWTNCYQSALIPFPYVDSRYDCSSCF